MLETASKATSAEAPGRVSGRPCGGKSKTRFLTLARDLGAAEVKQAEVVTIWEGASVAADVILEVELGQAVERVEVTGI
jgi:hypothetical protein